MEESLGNCHDGAAVGLLCHSGDLNAAYASQEQHVRSPGPVSARYLEVLKGFNIERGKRKKTKAIVSHLILKLQSRSIPRSFPARRRPGWFPVAGGRRSAPCPWPQGAAAARDAGSYLHCEKIGESIFILRPFYNSCTGVRTLCRW